MKSIFIDDIAYAKLQELGANNGGTKMYDNCWRVEVDEQVHECMTEMRRQERCTASEAIMILARRQLT